MEMLYKFGKGHLLSLGLPEMLMVWFTDVSGDSAVDSWRKSGQETQLWVRGYGFASRSLLQAKDVSSTKVILMSAVW